MTDVSLPTPRPRLCELVNRLETGETVRITRRGEPVAELRPVTGPRKPIDLEALDAMRDAMTSDPESAGDDLGLRAADALHLAVASGNGASICTLDRVMAEAGPILSIETLLLRGGG